MIISASTTRAAGRFIWRWIDSWADLNDPPAIDPKRVEAVRVLPFLLLHPACLAVYWVGFSWTAFSVAVAMYGVRMFGVTAFYHRYFAHQTYQTSRIMQFLFATLGVSSGQRGPLWWAANHRLHHKHADTAQDEHSPIHHGFWWSHIWWLTSPGNTRTKVWLVQDLVQFPELVFLDRFHVLIPTLLAFMMYGFGWLLEIRAPELGTSGSQMLVWGFFISTVVLFHATFTINSLSHLLGSRRFATPDNSRNSFLLAILTMGEGWHNNHHHCPASVQQGFYWWEIDFTYYGLKLLEFMRLIWDLKEIPIASRNAALESAQSGGTNIQALS